MNHFNTSNNIALPIIDGFRDRLKPNWKSAFRDFEYSEMSLEKANKLKHDINLASNLLNYHGINIEGKDILDVGCYLGVQCIGALEKGANSATGIDIPDYYVNQAVNQDVNASEVLKSRRNHLLSLHPNVDSSKLFFEDLSVFEMEYENSFDIIFSWETFEHIIDPKEALRRIEKALKPGGISFNVYNPFFCITGGHSMCTLDYPFAHIILSDYDFKKYIQQNIPKEVPSNYVDLSYNFFTKNLNRMTQANLRDYIDQAKLELLEFISIPDFNILNSVDPIILSAAKELYPTLNLNDLLSSYVYFIVQKND